METATTTVPDQGGGRDDALSASEQLIVSEMQARDREVREHERIRAKSAGALSPASSQFVLQTGPDGKRYAIDSKLQIDLSPGLNASDTVARVQQVQDAVLSSAAPSSSERSMAVRARTMEQQARAQISREEKIRQQQVNEYLRHWQDQPAARVSVLA